MKKVLLLLFLVFTLTTNIYADSRFMAITDFTLVDKDTITFNLNSDDAGFELIAHGKVFFHIPKSHQHRIISHAMLEYRKEAKYGPGREKQDKNNAWLQFSIHDSTKDKWLLWQDQFGAKKRAAVRSSKKPKKNTFYNCPELVGRFLADKVMIENIPEGEKHKARARIHKFSIIFLADNNSSRNSKPRQITKKINSATLRYSLNEKTGTPLYPNQSMEFAIPEQFQKRPIAQMVLRHRKDPSLCADPNNLDTWDPNPAYVLVEALDVKHHQWHRWVDSNGSAKFSEVRQSHNPEDETLHNCLKCLGSYPMSKIRLTNVGRGKPQKSVSMVHGLDLLFAPATKNYQIIENIYTKETVFATPEGGKPVPLFGGGPRLNGKFPGAVVLGAKRLLHVKAIAKLPAKHRFTCQLQPDSSDYVDQLGRLHIPLPEQKKLEYVELAIGDLDNTTLKWNKDGYFGRSGRAEITVKIQNVYNKQREFLLLLNQNSGMACLIACGGPAKFYQPQQGDELVIISNHDTAFLMGYRLRFSD